MPEELKDRLVKYRNLAKKSQQQVADAIGMERRNYAKYEDGTRVPKFDTVKAIAACIECDPMTLMYGDKSESENTVKSPSIPFSERNSRVRGLGHGEFTEKEAEDAIIQKIVERKRKQHSPTGSTHIKCKDIWWRYEVADNILRSDEDSPVLSKTDPVVTRDLAAFLSVLKDLEEKGVLTGNWEMDGALCPSFTVSNEQARTLSLYIGVYLRATYYEELRDHLQSLAEPNPHQAIHMARKDYIAKDSVYLICEYQDGLPEELEEEKKMLDTIVDTMSSILENQTDITKDEFAAKLGIDRAALNKARYLLSHLMNRNGWRHDYILAENHIFDEGPVMSLSGDAILYMENGDRLTLSAYQMEFPVTRAFLEQVVRVETDMVSLHTQSITIYAGDREEEFYTPGLILRVKGYPSLCEMEFAAKVAATIPDDACVHLYGSVDKPESLMRYLRLAIEKTFKTPVVLEHGEQND